MTPRSCRLLLCLFKRWLRPIEMKVEVNQCEDTRLDQHNVKHKSRTSCLASTKPTSGRSYFQPYNFTAPRNSRPDVKHSATQPTLSHDIQVCPSLACNSSTDQTNTTGLNNNVPHIKNPTERERLAQTHPVRASANPNQMSTQHMTYASHTAQSVPLHNHCQFPSADTETSMPVHEPTETQRLVSKRLQIKTQRFDLQGRSASAKADDRHILYTLALWTTATRESPQHGDPFYNKQMLPHCRRSMTTAYCSSPAYRTQEPSNH